MRKESEVENKLVPFNPGVFVDEYGFTEENAPRFTAFATTQDRLYWHMDGEHRPMYVFEEDGVLCGYYSLLLQGKGERRWTNG